MFEYLWTSDVQKQLPLPLCLNICERQMYKNSYHCLIILDSDYYIYNH